MNIVRICFIITVIALIAAFLDASGALAASNQLPGGRYMSTQAMTTTPDTDNSMHTPLYSCSYDAAGNVVQCVVVGTYNPDKPQIEQ